MTPLIACLSPREEQVLEHLARGCDLHGTARSLGVGYYTARGYVTEARRKLGAVTTAHAVAIYVRSALLEAVPA